MRAPLTEHPAKYSDAVLQAARPWLVEEQRVLRASPLLLDPFAGVGRVHRMLPEQTTVGVELEPEWASCHRRTINANALALPFADRTFDVVMTSPCYGNRMADHHDAKDGSKRRTYRHTLGRPLHEDNAGKLQWGDEYRRFHRAAWRESARVLKIGGLFLLNVSDHVRAGKVQHVVAFHAVTLGSCGLVYVDSVPVQTPRMRYGEHAEIRVDHEVLLVLRNMGQIHL